MTMENGLSLFDPAHSPVDGSILIEASAGTGKTWTISALVVRLLLEKEKEPGVPLGIDQILVVTFTEAATAELRDRIRKRLSETLDVLEGRREAEDPFLSEMKARHGGSTASAQRIRAAIANFDRAAIFTIHGFCHRMLRDNSFESGLRFDAELVEDAGVLVQDAADDVWRNRFVDASPRETEVLAGSLTPDRLARLVSFHIKPEQHIRPDGEPPEYDSVLSDLEEVARRTKAIWESDADTIKTLLMEDPNLSRAKLRQAWLLNWFDRMDVWAKAKSPFTFEKFDRFSESFLATAVKKGKVPPEHRFFSLCDAVLEREEEALEVIREARACFLRDMMLEVAGRQESLKEAQGALGFDDLLILLERAISKDPEGGMSARIRDLFGAALIDEFQDTDPIQYRIFETAFREHGVLFLIGDPKQAIYAFRGADVHAYLGAAREATHRFTLACNWRSDRDVIEATNTVFSANENPFCLSAMPFHPVGAAPKDPRGFVEPEGCEAIVFWELEGEEGGKAAPAGTSRVRIMAAVCDEIVRLVEAGRNGTARIGDTPISEGDLAVLVRTNGQATEMKDALSARNVAAVVQSSGNVFDSPEASDLARVLDAVETPNHEGRIRRAMATPLLGHTAREIDAASRDEHDWNRLLAIFRSLHDTWIETGVMPMLRELFDTFDMLVKSVEGSDGERRVTNLLHLAELFHQSEAAGKSGMAALLEWFEGRMDPERPGRGEFPMRLESDADRVRIVTIHKSKGLEYPIVFCPFPFNGVDVLQTFRNPEGILSYHDEILGTVLDLEGSRDEEAIAKASLETLAEDVRLLYVALTRSCHRTYICWGNIGKANLSAAGWLFHGKGDWNEKEGVNLENLHADLVRIRERAPGKFRLDLLPESEHRVLSSIQTENPALSRRTPKLPEYDGFRVSSFSALVSGAHVEFVDDRDAIAEPPVMDETPTGIFAFPAGAAPGTFIHAIFEHLDFTGDAAHKEAVTADQMERYGIEEEWKPVLLKMVADVLATPMGEKDTPLRLSEIPDSDRLNELEFYFPLNPIESDAFSTFVHEMTAASTDTLPEKLGKLTFSPQQGFLHGFMDLVFRKDGKYWLLDWKSNRLGTVKDAYDQTGMAREMAAHLYTLQYHLYIVALNRYLETTLADYDYERDFGGALYVFVRGVSEDGTTGVFFHKPEADVIAELSGMLIADTSGGF